MKFIMKKYILMMLVVLAAGVTSCSNDDIPLKEDVTMKTFETTFVVDPSGVVESYRFESYPGELTVVPSEAQLRIRILIYNSNGDLVDVLSNKQSNYQSVWSAKKYLEAGSYTALAISDVVNTNDPNVNEYWILEDYEKINEAKLIKEFDFLGYQKEILGMNSISFSVIDSSSEVSVSLKPAGAACYLAITSLEEYNNVHGYHLFTDHKVNHVFWDSSYKMKVNKEIASGTDLWGAFNNSVGGCIGLGDGEEDYGAFSAMFYLLPGQNQYFTFVAETVDSNYIEIGTQMYITNIKEGEQYFFLCELDSSYDNYAQTRRYNVTGKTYDEWFEDWYWENLRQYDNSRIMNVHDVAVPSLSMQKKNNAVYIKDLINK